LGFYQYRVEKGPSVREDGPGDAPADIRSERVADDVHFLQIKRLRDFQHAFEIIAFLPE
jgi:hypothetical protein